MRRITRNVFLNEDTEQLVDCTQIPRVSLKPWTGKSKKTKYYSHKVMKLLLKQDCADETEILLSRPIRETRTKDERIVKGEDLGKSYINLKFIQKVPLSTIHEYL